MKRTSYPERSSTERAVVWFRLFCLFRLCKPCGNLLPWICRLVLHRFTQGVLGFAVLIITSEAANMSSLWFCNRTKKHISYIMKHRRNRSVLYFLFSGFRQLSLLVSLSTLDHTCAASQLFMTISYLQVATAAVIRDFQRRHRNLPSLFSCQ